MTERTVNFAGGISRPDTSVDPEFRPAVAPPGLARFVTNGAPIDQIRVVVMQWTWKARNIVYPGRVDPGPIEIGTTQHEFFLIRRESRVAERLEFVQGYATPFFKAVVRWSCLWSPPREEREEQILFWLLGRLNLSGMSYIYPRYTPGYSTPFTGNAAELDTLLDRREGQCGMWTEFFAQLASAQGVGSMEWQSPVIRLPGATVTSEQNDPTKPTYFTVPNPRDPNSVLILNGFQGPADFNHYADTFKTKMAQAVNGQEMEWTFGDHCYIGRAGWTYDPSFQRLRRARDWLAYFNNLRRGRDDFFVMSPNAAHLPTWWVGARGTWYPAEGTWTSKGRGDYKYALLDRITGDSDEGTLQNR